MQGRTMINLFANEASMFANGKLNGVSRPVTEANPDIPYKNGQQELAVVEGSALSPVMVMSVRVDPLETRWYNAELAKMDGFSSIEAWRSNWLTNFGGKSPYVLRVQFRPVAIPVEREEPDGDTDIGGGMRRTTSGIIY